MNLLQALIIKGIINGGLSFISQVFDAFAKFDVVFRITYVINQEVLNNTP